MEEVEKTLKEVKPCFEILVPLKGGELDIQRLWIQHIRLSRNKTFLTKLPLYPHKECVAKIFMQDIGLLIHPSTVTIYLFFFLSLSETFNKHP